MKVYISGCGGMLGEAVYPCFSDSWEVRATDIDMNEAWLAYTDVRDFEAYRKDVVEFEPDALVHMAALTSLEYCEQHPAEAHETNTKGAAHATLLANELDIPIVYIGSAGIFDGKKDVYYDSDVPNPLNHYARSKYDGERYVAKHAAKPFVFRAGWMTGGGPRKDKKFANKILQQIREGCRELFVVNDKEGTPTYTYDFARNMETMLRSEHFGVYNMVCEEMSSRLEVAREIVRALNRENEITITEVTSDYFKAEYFAKRPRSERLVNAKLNGLQMNLMGNWRKRIDDYVRRHYADLIRR